MIFLPIAARELRVAARKRSTIWFRVLAASVAMVIGVGFLMMSLAVGTSAATLGRGLFGTLTWLAFGAAIAAGLFFTADCLSEEKREETLGFLFLTDLRGYDVVAGKLLATSLRSCYALLALFPVLSVTLLLGGIAGAQLWKSALAVLNALFVSLAAGLLISSLCRDSQRAMAGTFLLLLLVCAAGPVIDSIWSISHGGSFKPVLTLASPLYVFYAASAWGKSAYWSALCVSHVVAWIWFALACLLVPRTWRARVRRASGSALAWAYSWKYGWSTARTKRRRKLIELTPVLWLASRERWQVLGVWAMAILVLIPFVAVLCLMPSMAWIIWSQLSWLALWVLYLWTASQASRFFLEARRSGLMELLMVTPLTNGEIVAGQWRALVRFLGVPAALVLVVQIAGASFLSDGGLARALVTSGNNTSSSVLNFLAAALGAICSAANLVALGWFGMWMGLTSKNPSMATLKTLLFVQVIPSLGISFASVALAGLLMVSRVISAGGPSNSSMMAFPSLRTGLWTLMVVAKNIAFVAWARHRLYNSFREEASGNTHWHSSGPEAPKAMPVPPVLSAQP